MLKRVLYYFQINTMNRCHNPLFFGGFLRHVFTKTNYVYCKNWRKHCSRGDTDLLERVANSLVFNTVPTIMDNTCHMKFSIHKFLNAICYYVNTNFILQKLKSSFKDHLITMSHSVHKKICLLFVRKIIITFNLDWWVIRQEGTIP